MHCIIIGVANALNLYRASTVEYTATYIQLSAGAVFFSCLESPKCDETSPDLRIRFGEEAEQDESHDGSQVDEERVHECHRRPRFVECQLQRASQEHEDGTWSENRHYHYRQLVCYVDGRYVLVDGRRLAPRADQIGDVGHRRRNPASPLVEELFELFRCLGVRVRGRTVLD